MVLPTAVSLLILNVGGLATLRLHFPGKMSPVFSSKCLAVSRCTGVPEFLALLFGSLAVYTLEMHDKER